MVCEQSTSDNNIWDETLFQRYGDSNSWTYDCTSRLAASEQWWFQCKQYRNAAATMRRMYNVIAHHSGGGERTGCHWTFHWKMWSGTAIEVMDFIVIFVLFLVKAYESNGFLVCMCALGLYFWGNAFYIPSHYILLQLAGMHVYSYAAIMLGFSFYIYHKKLCMKCNYLSALAMLCKKALKTNYSIIHVYSKR